MLELGEESLAEHQQIFNLAKSLGFDEIITVGQNFAKVDTERNFPNTETLIEYLKTHPIRSQNLLLKGSRGIALEKLL